MSFLKKILISLISLVIFFIAFIAFIDKQKVFNVVQNELHKKSVLLVPKKVESEAFGMKLTDVNVYYNKSLVANINSVNFDLYSINMKNIVLKNILKDIFDFKVSSINYSLGDFTSVYANGEMGKTQAFLDLNRKKVKIEITPSKKLKNSPTTRHLKKSNGKMYHELTLQ